MSSFGFSGTNAHIIVEESPAEAAAEEVGEPATQVLTLSARTGTALEDLIASYSKDLASAGLPRPQADVIANGMMTIVAQQFDSLVTREHFDVHSALVDKRFEQVDQRFEQVDKRFEKIDKQLDSIVGRLTKLELLKAQVNLHT